MVIGELRKVIEEKTGVEVNRQRLIYKAKLLKDELRLNDYSNNYSLRITAFVNSQGRW
jgi:hypothetical protein